MSRPNRPHLVIPQPPTHPLPRPINLPPDAAIPHPNPVVESIAFHSQITLIDKLVAAKKKSWVRKCPLPARCFRTQIAEIDALLDGVGKFENLCTLAADDCPSPTKDKHSTINSQRPPLNPVRRWEEDLNHVNLSTTAANDYTSPAKGKHSTANNQRPPLNPVRRWEEDLTHVNPSTTAANDYPSPIAGKGSRTDGGRPRRPSRRRQENRGPLYDSGK